MRCDPMLLRPFRDELTRIGFRELRTAEAVVEAITTLKGTQLLVINSICGCAAGKARSEVAMALIQFPAKSDYLTTVFAGGDIEARVRVREHLGNLLPSSTLHGVVQGWPNGVFRHTISD